MSVLRGHLSRTVTVSLLALTLLLAASPAQAVERFHPSEGDLYYNGQWYADSYLLWDDVGDHNHPRPAYEHDLTINATYFATCTAYSDLPSQYDDCPTAGKHEDDPTRYVFGFGSYDLKAVFEDNWYMGAWTFNGGLDLESPFQLTGQEVYNRCWPFVSSIWCMSGTGNLEVLVGDAWTKFYWGATGYWAWQY